MKMTDETIVRRKLRYNLGRGALPPLETGQYLWVDYGDFEEPWHERAFLCYDERDPERLWVLTLDGDI